MTHVDNTLAVHAEDEVREFLRHAMFNLREGNLETALEFAGKARKQSQSSQVMMVFAAIAHATGREVDALAILDQAIKKEPEIGNYPDAAAIILLKLGRKADGIFNLKLGTHLPSDSFLDEIIGNFFGDVKEIFDSFIENRPLVTAQLMADQGLYAAAVHQLETYIGVSGGDAESFALMTESAIHAGMLQHAEMAFAALSELAPSHPRHDYLALGIAILRGDEEKITQVTSGLKLPKSLDGVLALFRLSAATPMVPPSCMEMLTKAIADLVEVNADVEPFYEAAERENSLSFGFVCGTISTALEHLLISLKENLPIKIYICDTGNSQSFRRLRAAFDDIREVAAIDDATLIEMIRADRVTVLFDCVGAGQFARPSLWKTRAAPIQVLWPLYSPYDNPDLYDYRILGDGTMPSSDNRLVDLGVPLVFPVPPAELMSPIAEARTLKVERDPIGKGVLRLLAPHPGSRLPDRTLGTYFSILSAVPNATLSFVAQADVSDPLVSRILTMADQQECADRIDLINPIDFRNSHHEILLDADLILDSLPFGNVDLVTECIWIGAPILTLSGEGERQKASANMLRNIGSSDLIAISGADFLEKAVKLAGDRNARGDLRKLLLDANKILTLQLYSESAKAFVTKFRSLWENL